MNAIIDNNKSHSTTYLSDKLLLNYYSHDDLIHLNELLLKGHFEDILSNTIYNIDIEEEFPKQIMLSINLFCLLKLKKYESARVLISSNKQDHGLFSYDYLRAKLIFSNIPDILKGIREFYNIIKKYETDVYDWENNIEFCYFPFFFEKLFNTKDKPSKIKKCYFEIKTGFLKLGLTSEALKITNVLLERYPNDVVVMFEAYKQQLYSGSLKLAFDIEEQIKILNNENEKKYECYVIFCEFLYCLTNSNYSKAHSLLVSLIENYTGNILLMNNISLVNFYLNNIDKSKNDFRRIIEKVEMNASNDISLYNLQLINDTTTILIKK